MRLRWITFTSRELERNSLSASHARPPHASHLGKDAQNGFSLRLVRNYSISDSPGTCQTRKAEGVTA